MAPAHPTTRPEHMLPIMIVLGIMFVGICIAMNLFSRARFKKRTNAFSTTTTRSSNHRRPYRTATPAGPGAGRRLSSYCPQSPMPPRKSQDFVGATGELPPPALYDGHQMHPSHVAINPQTMVDESGRISVMTNSLKSCFDHDRNIMITIILLAFSVIGLIGLVIGNRFILIIFSASMTLILIASITIYAIGKTEEDSLKPKVPYYINTNPDLDSSHERTLLKPPLSKGGADSIDGGDYRLKSLVDRWLNKNNDPARHKNGRHNKTRGAARNSNPKLRAAQKRNQLNQVAATTAKPPALLEELSDEPAEAVPESAQYASSSIDARPILANLKGPSLADKLRDPRLTGADDSNLKTPTMAGNVLRKAVFSQPRHDMDQAEMDGNGGEQVENEQWVAYERYLYERYLNIVSQSIDLIMHTILASWMALLLDEDSDQCFGAKSSSSGHRSALGGAGRQTSGAREPPVYNYNGVRYSIRPDVDDSPAHIVVQ